MSLITRCPACKTMFKVVPDQLRISDGWVRCGQCDEIFDASAHLQGGGVEAETAAPDAPLEAPPTSAQTSVAVDAEVADDHHDSIESLAQETVSSSTDFSDEDADGPVEPVLGEFREADDVQAPTEDQTSGQAALIAEPGLYAPQELSFMRDANTTSRWHHPLVRTGLMLACLLLCLGMAVQLLVHERDRIAAVEPGLKPLVEEVCAYMQCTVAPLRQIESVMIDSSSFNRIRGDIYQLNFTLKNTAVTDLALPAIELSLTDTQDQPVMRRVFRPGELGVKSGVLPAASETSASLTLGVKTNGGAERMAGYRILAFYP